MRTSIPALLVVACLVVTGGASELELVENGSFEEVLSVGWVEETSGSNLYILRQTGFDGDPDYEIQVNTANGDGVARVRQSVVLPSLNVEFSAMLDASAVDGNGAWVAAGLALTYFDISGAPLGKTVLAALGDACPWTSDPTFHVIELGLMGSGWRPYGFKLTDELTNLPGIDPDDVRQLEVAVLVEAYNC